MTDAEPFGGIQEKAAAQKFVKEGEKEIGAGIKILVGKGRPQDAFHELNQTRKKRKLLANIALGGASEKAA